MSTFDEELDSLDAAFREDEEELAAKRHFEQSQLWQEHRKWHQEQGTQAQLVVWDDERPAPEIVKVDLAELPPKTQHIKVGGCECQPKLPFMQLEESGQVSVGIPPPIVEQGGAYNASSGTTTTYNAAPQANATYAQAPGQKDLYR